jgi:hypothetical protein
LFLLQTVHLDEKIERHRSDQRLQRPETIHSWLAVCMLTFSRILCLWRFGKRWFRLRRKVSKNFVEKVVNLQNPLGICVPKTKNIKYIYIQKTFSTEKISKKYLQVEDKLATSIPSQYIPIKHHTSVGKFTDLETTRSAVGLGNEGDLSWKTIEHKTGVLVRIPSFNWDLIAFFSNELKTG